MKAKRIPLLNREGSIIGYTKVDADWYEYLNRWTWRLEDGYAVRGRRISGKFSHIRVARLVCGLKDGDPRMPDHINRDRLDNRRSNLRIAERGHLDNGQNKPLYPNNTSGYRGVYWHSQSQRWRARTAIDGVRYHLGNFYSPEEANAVVSAFRAKNMPFSDEYAE
jgi:hypothetical protein